MHEMAAFCCCVFISSLSPAICQPACTFGDWGMSGVGKKPHLSNPKGMAAFSHLRITLLHANSASSGGVGVCQIWQILSGGEERAAR